MYRFCEWLRPWIVGLAWVLLINSDAGGDREYGIAVGNSYFVASPRARPALRAVCQSGMERDSH